MVDNQEALGKNVQQRRQERGKTQEELAHAVGLATSTLSKIERGEISSPSVFTVSAIAGELGCSIGDLLVSRAVPLKTSVKPIKDTFIFSDLNGVLVRFFHRAFADVAEEHHLSVDRVETLFWHYNDAADKGEISVKDFDKIMAEGLGIKSFNWGKTYLKSVEPIKPMAEFLSDASKKYPIGLLSNIHHGLIKQMLSQGMIPKLDYSCIVDSSEVGAIKPEQRVYEIAEKMSGTHGQNILFIDDSRANLIAAERFGWRVMWFDHYRPSDSVERIREALAL